MDIYYDVTWNCADHEDTPSSDNNRSEEFDTESEAIDFAKTINDHHNHYIVVTRCQIVRTFSSK